MRVIVLDGGPRTREARASDLRADGHQTHAAGHPHELTPDVLAGGELLLVAPLAEHDGEPAQLADALQLVRDVRSGAIEGANPAMPVIVVGADREADHVRAYRAGADIVLTSNASTLLISEAIKARLRPRPTQSTLLTLGNLQLDRHLRQVRVGDRPPVPLTRNQTAILAQLMQAPDNYASREDLYRDVWGSAAIAKTSRTLDSHASRLRHALQAAGATTSLEGVRGAGYSLQTPHPHR